MYQVGVVTQLEIVENGGLTQITQHCAIVHTVILDRIYWVDVLGRKGFFLTGSDNTELPAFGKHNTHIR